MYPTEKVAKRMRGGLLKSIDDTIKTRIREKKMFPLLFSFTFILPHFR